MARFNTSMRYDPDELAQRIAYYESLSKERQLDFIIYDYYSARVDNEDFDRRKVYETERAEYEKMRRHWEAEYALERTLNIAERDR